MKRTGGKPMSLDSRTSSPGCRFCGAALSTTFVDLGMSPLCESYLKQQNLNQMEPFFPLHVYVCDRCYLVQLEEYVSPEDIFSEYAYFSSYADTWVEHARQYTEMIIERLQLGANSQVVEVASNDGYLLQHFVAHQIPSLGIEPAANVAQVARDKGVATDVSFFGVETALRLADEGRTADLLIGNNVLAQVPDINDFVRGLKILLKAQGVITLEFPHIVRLVEGNQFDTIYHEHFSYFSLIAIQNIFEHHGLVVFDVDELATHGGSLRVFVRQADDGSKPVHKRVDDLRAYEENLGLKKMEYYVSFDKQVRETKHKLLEFLIGAVRNGKSIAGYGAPGKGNTLLNYCGIRTDFIEYTVDRNPYKQGLYLPGTHIPVYSPDAIRETKPDFVLILPWNFKEEITQQMSYVREWGAKFVVPIPEVTVF